MPATPPDVLPARPLSTPVRRVADLLARVQALRLLPVGADAQTRLAGCTHDSRTVRPGDLYAALPGARVHGAQFLAQAVAAGAAAVLTDEVGAALAAQAGLDLPVLVAADPRAVLGDLAACVYGDPAAQLLMIGITGTNGKTTTAFLVEAGLRAAGHRTGLLGTVQTRIAGDVLPSTRTTPEAPELQALLATMVERGVTAVVMEVSSHALALGRVDGIVFDTAVFTNLTQDHLDFHPSMADYEAAKAALFTPARARRGVVNLGDPAGRRLVATATLPLTTYDLAVNGGAGDARAGDTWAGDGRPADVLVEAVELRPDGSSFRLTGQVPVRGQVALPGSFNVVNATAALVALAVSGVDVVAAAAGIAALAGVPGRMERIDEGQPFLALVDYAHTPDAVRTALQAVRGLTTGNVIVVLGCGGDRDRAKRPLMGAAAVAGADRVVLTSDNPRSEDPQSIVDQMAAAAPGAVIRLDRAEAIAYALTLARPGDVVVVAGKGHETGQEQGGVVTPFDDRAVLRGALQAVRA